MVNSDPTLGRDKELVEFIIKQIVGSPDAVLVERVQDEQGILLNLHVDKNDMGKIIGKSGQTARALRVLLRIMGQKSGVHINLKIIEPAE